MKTDIDTQGARGAGQIEVPLFTATTRESGASRYEEGGALRANQALRAARSNEHGETCALSLPATLDRLASASAWKFCQRFEADSSRPLSATEREEIEAIYHAESVRAFAHSSLVPASRACLWGYGKPRGERRGLLPFRVLLAWRRAMRAAANQSRSWLWGKGAEELQFVGGVGMDDAATAAAESATWRGLGDGSRVQRRGMLWARGAGDARTSWRRTLAHLRACIVVYWRMASGKGGVGASREWRSGLDGDLEWLGAAAAAARGRGLVEWRAEWLGDGKRASKAAADRARRFLARVACGDAAMTAQPTAAAVILAADKSTTPGLTLAELATRGARPAGRPASAGERWELTRPTIDGEAPVTRPLPMCRAGGIVWSVPSIRQPVGTRSGPWGEASATTEAARAAIGHASAQIPALPRQYAPTLPSVPPSDREAARRVQVERWRQETDQERAAMAHRARARHVRRHG